MLTFCPLPLAAFSDHLRTAAGMGGAALWATMAFLVATAAILAAVPAQRRRAAAAVLFLAGFGVARRERQRRTEDDLLARIRRFFDAAG